MTRQHVIHLTCAVLTIAFLYYGLRKLAGFPAEVAIYEAIGIGQWPRYITGTVEVACAILLWMRGWRGVAAALLLATVLTGLAALLIWVGPPYCHMILLIAGSGAVAWVCHRDLTSRLSRIL